MAPRKRTWAAQCLLALVVLLLARPAARAAELSGHVEVLLGPLGGLPVAVRREQSRRETAGRTVPEAAHAPRRVSRALVGASAAELGAPETQAPSPSPPSAGQNATSGNATGGSSDSSALVAKQNPAAFSSAVMLLGMVCFVMLLFYLVNSRDADIRRSTWEMLSSAISIFCTILIFTSVKTIWSLAITDPKKSKGVGFHLMNWACFLLAFLCTPVLLLRFLKRPLPLAAWGTIGAHFIGFGGLEAFGYLLQKPPFSTTPTQLLVGVCLAGQVLWLLNFVSGKARHCYASWDGVVDEFEASWNHQCEHTETEYTGFIMGLLISMWVRFMITGEVPEVHGTPKVHSDPEVITIIWVAVVFVVMNVVLVCLLSRLTRPGRDSRAQRFAHVTIEISSMSTGWMVLHATEWGFWTFTQGQGINGDASQLTASMVMALCFSLITFAMLHVIDYIADRASAGSSNAIRQLNNPFTLLVAFSWEGTFYIAIKGLGGQYSNPVVRCFSMVGPMLGMCVIVLPAWILYIVPHTLHDHEDEHGDDHHGEHSKADAHSGPGLLHAELKDSDNGGHGQHWAAHGSSRELEIHPGGAEKLHGVSHGELIADHFQDDAVDSPQHATNLPVPATSILF